MKEDKRKRGASIFVGSW